MTSLIWSLLGWNEKEEPPSAAIIEGVRIPADGSRPHLLPLVTTAPSGRFEGVDSFLKHVPGLRPYWKKDIAWRRRDILRLDLQLHSQVELEHHLRLKHDLKNLLRLPGPGREELSHLRQRYLCDQHGYVLQPPYSHLRGAYYLFYSFALDDLPENPYAPPWICDEGPDVFLKYWGDVFIVKMAPRENGEDGRAIYEDILPPFLDLLEQGPLLTLPSLTWPRGWHRLLTEAEFAEMGTTKPPSMTSVESWVPEY